MQPPMRIIISMALLASAMASAYHSSVKLRRDGVLNLYPFPRVGRASRNTWQPPLSEMYLAYEPPSVTRQLYAFPRIGRTDLSLSRADSQEFVPMPIRRTETPGMWFGPRLGRTFKSDDDEITIQNESNDRSVPEQNEPVHEDLRKRQILY